MLRIERHIKLTSAVAEATNLCDRFDSADLSRIGQWVWEGYDRDLGSRAEWEERTQAGMELAMQITQAKEFPWPNASNVAFPLVTIAAMQFHSRAYPALVDGREVVKCRVIGEDSDGSKLARADRIGCHMSYQVLEEDQSWEEQHDRLLINLPIVGCAFKKTLHDADKSHTVGELVLARDLVLDYWAKSVEDCQRKTHRIPLYRNQMREKMLTGVFRDCTDEAWFTSLPATPTVLADSTASDRVKGLTPPASPDEDGAFLTLEQHTWADFDGDGYAEPYAITIDAATKEVLRIVARWDSDDDIVRTPKGKIVKIRADESFTKYPFIPSPDGGIYDIGFGVLLGPLNESVNSLLNQLVDAGTMANTAGGFLGRGAKIRGGNYTFAPLEWKRVDAPGDDLRKNIVPLEVREPSAVLFQLLSLLIDYTSRISASTDMMAGENPGQNTPAQTAQTMVEQGMKIYSALYKRIWRSMKQEFKLRYVLNGKFLPIETSFGSAGYKARREDYLDDPNSVCPAADPNVVSDSMRVQLAITVKQAAANTPGYDVEAVERNFLRALRVEGVEVMYPGLQAMPPGKSEKLALEEMRLEAKKMELQVQHQQFILALMEEQRLNSAKILQLQAHAAKLLGEADGTQRAQELEELQSQIEMFKIQDQAIQGRLELAMKAMELPLKNKELDVKRAELASKRKEVSNA